MRAFVTRDGEQVEIKVFQQLDLIDVFSCALIDFGKIAASCGGIHQSSDVSLLQYSERSRQKSMQQKKKIWKCFDQCCVGENTTEQLLPSCYEIKNIGCTADSGVHNQGIHDSGDGCGQHPVDFAVTMRQPTYAFSLLEWATMTSNLADKFRLNCTVLSTVEVYNIEVYRVSRTTEIAYCTNCCTDVNSI